METLKYIDPEIFEAIREEIERQQSNVELIASENYCSTAVLQAQGSILTNKYAEGYPDKRWYAGCGKIDIVEKLTVDRAKEIFGAEHANVQPHSGSQANMAVLFSSLTPGNKILSMDLSHGGHLTHGFKKNFSGQLYKKITYGVDKETEYIDYAELRALAKKNNPDLIIAGASSYPREIDFVKFKEIADEVGALFLADIAHIAGLIVAGLHQDPVPYADFVTTSTHKTLRGPRGGLILCKSKYASKIDQYIFPGIQGGPLMHVIAAKAVAFKEAKTKEFRECQSQTIKNAKSLANELKEKGYKIVSGGTDNHLFLVDLTNKNISGREAQETLEKAGIVLNRNMIPFDKRTANDPSGIRIGTPSVTTRGMKEPEMSQIANWIDLALNGYKDNNTLKTIKSEVAELCATFPIYNVDTALVD
ncbi:MAG: glycine hydroxymethyltransferase [Candidatus Scalindua rubra]|uniref:Serine hydroxymethyltransferase n=1 Tax=Candidatus Scalindua rubra TaxID=1872076 RepID=A0A1E3XCI0_9BACT|nr:MAG: glycine hydroxymethyltransferase [Candidatus Scalindua rubra]